MKLYDPKKKQFVYSGSVVLPASTALVTSKVSIHSDSWFRLCAIACYSYLPGPAPGFSRAFRVNLIDESTGRAVYSEPQSVQSFGANYASFSHPADYRKPKYLATPFMLRPNSVLRLEARDLAGVGGGVRFALIGEKVFDLNSTPMSPGSKFVPFDYVAQFPLMAAGTRQTVTVPIQSDADFDCVSIVSDFGALAFETAVGPAFTIQHNDLTTGYQFEDQPVHPWLVTGSALMPFYPISPIRFRRASGFNVTVANNTAGPVDYIQITYSGYKVVA